MPQNKCKMHHQERENQKKNLGKGTAQAFLDLERLNQGNVHM